MKSRRQQPPPLPPLPPLPPAEWGERVGLVASDGELLISRSAASRLSWSGLVLCLLIGSTYVVPFLAPLRPWTPDGDYVPFWNLVGRELMGQDAALETAQSEVEAIQRLARLSPTSRRGRIGATDKQVVGTVQQRPEQTPGTTSASVSAFIETASAGATLGAHKLQAPVVYPEYSPPDTELEPPNTIISGAERLGHFFDQLTLVELGTAGVIARAGHWGDSVLGNDGVTSGIRRRLQARFGDAGHGFHVLGRYNMAYRHQGVGFQDRGGWYSCQIIFKCMPDGRYGYGGVASTSPAGGTSRWQTAPDGFGSRVSRFEFWFAREPKGGDFQIKVNGQVSRVISTHSEEPEDGFAVFELEDGKHEFEVRAIGQGRAKGYGVVLERDGPGVVWDGLALIGAFTQRLDYQDAEHIKSQIARRQLDLMVFMFGGNDVQRETMDLVHTMQPYEEEYTRVIRKFRAGRPEASCIVMALVDHGQRLKNGRIVSRKIMPRLVASQRKVALAEGCAFFDTFEAMGGEGSVGRWYRAKPALAGADLAHPTAAGHEAIAALFYRSLMFAYGNFRLQRAGSEFEALAEIRASGQADEPR